ncbi:MAG TPA: LuxR family transcriptional regulator [Nocardioidaceae bacterium]|jgi:quercetin dioxygenase-like cupin family protein|nr:LuxR family transcriptional regulator [Nocardioidaceae bacterium]
MSDHAHDQAHGDAARSSEVVALGALGSELLAEARQASSGRAATTVATGPSQRATVIALVEDAELAEHDSPPAATLQVLAGSVRLLSAQQEWLLRAGDLVPVPPFRHSLTANADAVVLLTVALR